MKKKTKSSLISLLMCLCLVSSAVLSGCNTDTSGTAGESDVSGMTGTSSETTDVSSDNKPSADSIDYMALVNKTHPLPDDWEDKLETVHITNSVDDDVEVEKKGL